MANLLDATENSIWHAFDFLALEGDGTAPKAKLKVRRFFSFSFLVKSPILEKSQITQVLMRNSYGILPVVNFFRPERSINCQLIKLA